MTRKPSPAEWLALQPEAFRTRELSRLTAEAKASLNWRWRGWWARPEQVAPDGEWDTWLYLAGRGAGKTRSGAEWVREKVKAGNGRIGLIAPTAGDARDVMVEGESGILAVCWQNDATLDGTHIGKPLYEPSKRRVTWANGAQASLFSGEEPERLRGPQHDALWCDELAAWKYVRDTWDMAAFGLRLGMRPQTMVTTTPKPIPLVRELVKAPTTIITRGSTFDNAANLAPASLRKYRDTYEGTRIGRQELYAEILDDLPGALWTRDMIDATRRREVPEMQRIVIAVDPSGTKGKGASESEHGDDVGIIAAGLGIDGRGYVLADRTCNLPPDGWGRRAVNAYHEFGAHRLVAETNFGGDMVRALIATIDKRVAYKEVKASRGKVARAEPVAALYEQGRVSHIGGLPELEDQMCLIAPEGYVGEGSPDRADALVWALTELMLGPTYAWQNMN